MRIFIVFLFIVGASFCHAQTDTMFVEKLDGTILAYPLSVFNGITLPVITDVQEEKKMQEILSSFMLFQNYPNPFNPSTTIQYSIPIPGDVKIAIYDVQGRVVRSFDSPPHLAGNNSITWDSRNDDGALVTSGMYFCQVLFNNNSLVKKLLLLK